MDEIIERTTLLKESPDPMFVRLRALLSSRGIDPAASALAQLFTDDNSFEFGVLACRDGRVFQFGYDYLGRDSGSGQFTEFEDWTSTWQAQLYAEEVATARSYLAAT
jgi:hypothetical protein